MGGCLKKAWRPGHRKGVIYEFDYASEKILNTYSLKNTFYRAYELGVDWDLCAEKLPKPENPILGNYYTFQEGQEQNVPKETVISSKIHCSLTDSFLYVHSQNHQISQIELVGIGRNTQKKCYYFQPAAQDGEMKNFGVCSLVPLFHSKM